MKKYLVHKEPLTLGYDSHVHAPTPRRHKTHPVGTVLTLDCEAPNGNVWFIDEDGERGKIACGSVENLIKRERLNPMKAGAS